MTKKTSSTVEKHLISIIVDSGSFYKQLGSWNELLND
jgi:hypothetical protein